MSTAQSNQEQVPEYLDPFSILVINSQGKLCRLHCPFVVLGLSEREGVVKGKEYPVDMVKLAPPHLLEYVIAGKSYPHSWFRIELKG